VGNVYYVVMTHRTCFRCTRSLEATPGNFHREKSRPLGLSYECKECHSERKKGRDRRKERWGALTPEQKVLRKARMLRYGRTQRGRATYLRNAYQRIDECDLTSLEILEFITQPCVYCGTVTDNRGLDRIDNSLPHIKGNVQTACTGCNIMRGDRFTVEEMMLIGKTVSEIHKTRNKTPLAIQSEGHQETTD
jgi:hypothetical protein